MKFLWRIYDDREMEFLRDKGFSYELLMRDVRSDQLVWIFLNNHKLQETIKQYKQKKKPYN